MSRSPTKESNEMTITEDSPMAEVAETISPLPMKQRYNFRSNTRQEEARLMNVLNGEIQKNWVISEEKRNTSKKQSTPVLSLKKYPPNRLVRRFSESPVSTSPTTQKTLRRKLTVDAKPAAFHRIQDTFELEIDPFKQEVLVERSFTSFLKHEQLSEASKQPEPKPMETENKETKNEAMEIELSLLPPAIGGTVRSASPTITNINFDAISESSTDTFVLPKLKRKLSDSPDTRFEPYKRSFFRPGTPSPSASSPGSPWRSYERLKRLKKNAGVDGNSSDEHGQRRRTSSLPRTPRFSSISSDHESIADIDDKDTLSQASTTREYQERYEWRQTDEDEWDYEENFD